MADLDRVHATFRRYVEARNALLGELGLGRQSNRDPLAEFSEWLVAALVGGTLAHSPVQRDWDVQAGNDRIQVKYLANPPGGWINEHEIHTSPLMTHYAIVLFEALLPTAVLVFPARGLAAISAALGKRHPNQEMTLQFTRHNYEAIMRDRAGFAALGMRIYEGEDWGEAGSEARH
jgi:hypothetical protein